MSTHRRRIRSFYGKCHTGVRCYRALSPPVYFSPYSTSTHDAMSHAHLVWYAGSALLTSTCSAFPFACALRPSPHPPTTTTHRHQQVQRRAALLLSRRRFHRTWPLPHLTPRRHAPRPGNWCVLVSKPGSVEQQRHPSLPRVALRGGLQLQRKRRDRDGRHLLNG